MKVEISDINATVKVVWADGNRVGTITRYGLCEPYRWGFVWYSGASWERLSCNEATEIYAVVDKKVNMLNITARLMG